METTIVFEGFPCFVSNHAVASRFATLLKVLGELLSKGFHKICGEGIWRKML